VRSQPYARLRVLMRRSHPVRHFDGSAEGPASFQLLSGQAGFPFAGNDDGANTQVGKGVVHGSFAVPAVTVRGARPAWSFTRWIAGANCGASAGFPACTS
jgi:hypothetical protein